MLWSLLKILLFIAAAAALAWGAGLLMEAPGEVRIAFVGREYTLSPLGFVIALLLLLLAAWVVLKILGLLIAILRFLIGDQTAITRYFDRNRERRGFDALSQALIALAAGEGRRAQAKAQQAERLLNRPQLTRLLNAQAAEINGNTERAMAYYKDMLTDEQTKFVGVQGLLRQKLIEGDTDTALKLAEKAFALQPRHEGTLQTLFGLQAQARDWSGARRTLAAKVRASTLPRDVGKRREAVLSLADARAALADNEQAKAREAAYAANRLSPSFGPAAALAAELHAQAGDRRQAARIVKKAWTEAPHPDLAAAFAAIVPDETPAERRNRFEALLKIQPDHPETRMVAAELALADEDFPGARRALGDLAERRPTARSLALMAAIERGEGAPDTVVRGWLAKALDAPRGEAWVCDVCNTVHGQWAPICENCQSFDTLSWQVPPQSEDAGSTAAAMLPLIVGALEDRRPEPEPEPEPEPARGGTDAGPAAAAARTASPKAAPEPVVARAEVDADETPHEPETAAEPEPATVDGQPSAAASGATTPGGAKPGEPGGPPRFERAGENAEPVPPRPDYAPGEDQGWRDR
ncbi:heme biosynthesis protein HemY [Rhodobacteraceae bacterium 2CG4]|uniref:Heme biosynthesis protein HemY n=1 Tax=Halovulum marinum TaxID=2662447 RepID=A0A6L5Z3U0_9RHOB|nr:heme biosynthesis HemY N-terminal domain-containing protein [Halovulum marinum]MSU91187.1 heme biosynthesis protein HemY [Halovulum marinum]